jgi:predicted nuclease with TOPRIM domain
MNQSIINSVYEHLKNIVVDIQKLFNNIKRLDNNFVKVTEAFQRIDNNFKELDEKLNNLEQNKPSLNNKEPIIVKHSDNTITVLVSDYNDLRKITDTLTNVQIREIKLIQ